MAQHSLILATQMGKLMKNAAESARTGDGSHFEPVVKLFTPDGNATWLITEIDTDGDTMFGLCDLGMGEPELGYVSLTEIKGIRGRFGLPVERDAHFKAHGTIGQYAARARSAGRIVEIAA